MTEDPKCVRIYQAQSEAPDLDDGVEFLVEGRMRNFENGHEIDVTFSSGTKRTFCFREATDSPPGFVVSIHHPSWATSHLNIIEVEPRKYRVVYPNHFKDVPPPWNR